MKKRCDWSTDDPVYIAYHDEVWGVPVHDDRELFEFLILEGAQAGLSWITILKRRDNYAKAFDNFDYSKIANYTDKDIERLMADSGIIRNRRKIESAIKNANAALVAIGEYGSLDRFFWSYVGGEVTQNKWAKFSDMPIYTEVAEKMSKDLKKRGFNFVGPTICYSFMQAVGMVNDHTTDCFRHKELL